MFFFPEIVFSSSSRAFAEVLCRRAPHRILRAPLALLLRPAGDAAGGAARALAHGAVGADALGQCCLGWQVVVMLGDLEMLDVDEFDVSILVDQLNDLDKVYI